MTEVIGDVNEETVVNKPKEPVNTVIKLDTTREYFIVYYIILI